MTRCASTWLTLVVGMLMALSVITISVHAAGTRASNTGACATSKKLTPRGNVTYSDWQFPTTLNTNQTLQGIALLTNELQDDTLVRYDSRASLYPLLLTVVPSQANGGISKDGKTIYLHLKRGLHWSNGALMTSHQIWFAWKIDRDPLSGPACLGTCDKIASITTPNAYEAVLHMTRAYASAVPRALPDIMVEAWHSSAGGWSKDNYHQAAYELYQDPGFNFAAPDYPTSGPYQVTKFAPGKSITLRPNPHYSNMSCGARLASITFRAYPSKKAMIAAAARRQSDLTLDYHPADLGALHGSAGKYTVHDVPSFVYEHLELNVDRMYYGKPNPLGNRNVRLAMALAVDKAGIVSASLGLSAPAARQIVANNPWVWRPTLKQPFTDTSITGQWDPVAKRFVTAGSAQARRDARTLLRSTQWKNGFSLDAVTTQIAVRMKTLAEVAAAWKKLGIKTVITSQPDDTLFGTWADNGTLAHGRFQVALFSWVGSPDPDSWVNEMGGRYVDRRQVTHSDLNQNYAGFTDSVIDSGFRRGASTYDRAQRAAAYHAVQQELNRQAYWIGLYYRDAISTSDGKIKHYAPSPTTSGETWNAYDWAT